MLSREVTVNVSALDHMMLSDNKQLPESMLIQTPYGPHPVDRLMTLLYRVRTWRLGLFNLLRSTKELGFISKGHMDSLAVKFTF